MKRYLSLLATFAITTAPLAFAASANADAQQMERLVPDVVRPRKAERTHVFSTAQFIYPLGSDRYLHRWVDRPLFVDPALAEGKAPTDWMTLRDYERMQQIAQQYGLDGFGLFPEPGDRWKFYDYTQQSSVKNFQLLPQLLGADYRYTTISKPDFIRKVLQSPASFRLDGKIVLTSYRVSAGSMAVWKNTLADLRKEFGDTFIFLPALDFFDNAKVAQDAPDIITKYHTNAVTPADIQHSKEYLREWLRIGDGVIFNNPLRLRWRYDLRRFDADFYENFVIRILKSVLAEPEFKNKYLGLSAMIGFENSTRVGYSLSHDGTKTLRRSMETAMSAQPDFIEIPEWDEQNENDVLRPTVYNGLSTMRIMRYYTGKLKGEKPTPLPGDNIAIPDITLSYRKVLTLGEKLQVELLNVPDTDKSAFYKAQLSLKDPAGKIVYTSPWYQFDRSRMQDHTVILPSENLWSHQVLIPQLEIKTENDEIAVKDGLLSIELRPTWNWDYKWVKQPIRDLLHPRKAGFTVSDAQADGTRLVSGEIQATEPLASVEVLDNNNVVYSYPLPTDATHAGWHESAERVIIGINWQSFPLVNLEGEITLKNAQGRWLDLDKATEPRGATPPPSGGQTFSFNKRISSSAPRSLLLALDRADAGKAQLEINLPGIYQGSISIEQLLRKGIYGIVGRKGFNLVLSRFAGQASMPKNLHLQSVRFENVPVLPDQISSILAMRAIGVSGRIYRSKPVPLAPRSDTLRPITVFSDTQQQAVTFSVPENLVPNISYQFNPEHGSAVLTKAGRPFWGILGGYFAQVTGRGGGNYGDDTAFIYRDKNYPPYSISGPIQNAVVTAPEWVKTENGEYALKFDGKGTFLTLPQGVIPRRAASTITMDIHPDSATGQQLIIGNRNYNPGSFTIYTDNGTLKMDAQMEGYRVFTAVDTGLQLPAGKWSHLVIRFDQKNLQLTVNQQSGKKIAMKGPGQRTTASVIGGIDKRWFKGEIKNLRIQHG